MKCGDVGTTAEVVEKSYSHCFTSEKSGTVVCLPVQNRIPKCKYFKVVLLDEADVFLDMKDLNRNALVSVFLRELEYDDGILILTSNHVVHSMKYSSPTSNYPFIMRTLDLANDEISGATLLTASNH